MFSGRQEPTASTCEDSVFTFIDHLMFLLFSKSKTDTYLWDTSDFRLSFQQVFTTQIIPI
jgi:hypothetical protein